MHMAPQIADTHTPQMGGLPKEQPCGFLSKVQSGGPQPASRPAGHLSGVPTLGTQGRLCTPRAGTSRWLSPPFCSRVCRTSVSNLQHPAHPEAAPSAGSSWSRLPLPALPSPSLLSESCSASPFPHVLLLLGDGGEPSLEQFLACFSSWTEKEKKKTTALSWLNNEEQKAPG